MDQLKKILLSKNLNLILFLVAFLIIYIASNTQNSVLSIAGILIVLVNLMMILVQKN